MKHLFDLERELEEKQKAIEDEEAKGIVAISNRQPGVLAVAMFFTWRPNLFTHLGADFGVWQQSHRQLFDH